MSLKRQITDLENRLRYADLCETRARSAAAAKSAIKPFDFDGFRAYRIHQQTLICRPSPDTTRSEVRERLITLRANSYRYANTEPPPLDEAAIDAEADRLMGLSNDDLDTARRACGFSHLNTPTPAKPEKSIP